MASFGGGVGNMSYLSDVIGPLDEMLSKSDSLKGLRPEIIISESDVSHYSRMLWLKDENGEARRKWSSGKEMRFTLLREEEVVLNRLRSLEIQDYMSVQKENSVSDDESN